MVCVMCQQVCTVLSEVSVSAVHDEPRCGPLLFSSSEVMIVMAILQRGGIKKKNEWEFTAFLPRPLRNDGLSSCSPLSATMQQKVK